VDFEFSADQQAIRDAIAKICAKYGDDYWLARDTDGAFPEDFVHDIATGGWLGIAMPEAHGGAGLGVTEAAIVAQTIAQSGACLSGASSIHINLFGPMPIVVFGTDEQKAKNLPPLIAGTDRCCFGVTEPDAGLNTMAITTKAERDGDHYVISGQKTWSSRASFADWGFGLFRTEEGSKRHKGLSFILFDLNSPGVTRRPIRQLHGHRSEEHTSELQSRQ